MIRDGRTIASGDVSTLIHSSGHTGVELTIYTIRPIPDDSLRNISAMESVSSAERKGKCTVSIGFQGTPEQQAAIAKAVFDSGAGMLSMNERGASLETFYMELTEGEKP
jgi:ABC-type multidrug transport system ATPase subunit